MCNARKCCMDDRYRSLQGEFRIFYNGTPWATFHRGENRGVVVLMEDDTAGQIDIDLVVRVTLEHRELRAADPSRQDAQQHHRERGGAKCECPPRWRMRRSCVPANDVNGRRQQPHYAYGHK